MTRFPLLRAGASSGTNPVPGVSIPKGALDRYKPLRAQAKAGSILGEIVMFGDSTTWGQLVTTNTTTGDPRYPLPQRLRAIAVASGYPDGGQGIFGTRSGTGSGGTLDTLVPEVSRTGTWAEGFYAPLRQLAWKNTSNVAGDSLTVQFRIPSTGGSLRIDRALTTPASTAAWTYAIDGGSTVTLPAITTGSRRIKTTVVTGLSAGTHTLVLTLTTPGAGAGFDEWDFEALGPNGLCVQNYGVLGSKASGRFDIAGMAQEAYALGYYEDATQTTPGTPYMVLNGRAGSVRNPILAIHHLGINDMLNGSANFASTAAASDAVQLVRASVGSFAELCREACDGVVVIPQLTWGTNNAPYAGSFRAAMRDTALSYGLAVADLQIPLGGRSNYALYGSGVHLNAAGYDVQAQWLWDNVLNAA